MGDTWYITKKDIEITLIFFSQSKTLHQAVFFFQKAVSSTNQYINFKVQKKYFNKSEIEQLKEFISPAAISSALNEWEKQQAIEDDFK